MLHVRFWTTKAPVKSMLSASILKVGISTCDQTSYTGVAVIDWLVNKVIVCENTGPLPRMWHSALHPSTNWKCLNAAVKQESLPAKTDSLGNYRDSSTKPPWQSTVEGILWSEAMLQLTSKGRSCRKFYWNAWFLVFWFIVWMHPWERGVANTRF